MTGKARHMEHLSPDDFQALGLKSVNQQAAEARCRLEYGEGNEKDWKAIHRMEKRKLRGGALFQKEDVCPY